MKKLFILAITVVSLFFISCTETETIIKEKIVEKEVIITETETKYVFDAGELSITYPTQDTLRSGSGMQKLASIKINGFKQYSTRRMYANLETNSSRHISEVFSEVVIKEVNNKLPTKTIQYDELSNDDLYIRYSLQGSGQYFFDGTEHVIEIFGIVKEFSETEQLFLDNIELSLEKKVGENVEYEAELDTRYREKTFFLVP